MLVKDIVRHCTGVTASFAIALSGSVMPASAQSATEASLFQAGYNAGQRLVQEGFSLNTLEGAPDYTTFLESREVRTVSVTIPRTGNYVLLVGGDNDTVDLDIYFPSINGSDVSFGRTAFLEFNVYRPGKFYYEIDMLDCQTGNCGVYAVLLRVGN